MFFKSESKRIAALESKVNNLSSILDVHGKLIRSMVDGYKHVQYGLKADGTPRKKPGRPRKVVAV
jgi:hypothetical protein